MNTCSDVNIFTAYEIFLEKLYNFSSPHRDNVIIDIGMNVGYASLFFASLERTAHVYSYEPFPETFKEATANINLNPQLQSKISLFNYGLSDKTNLVDVPVFESGAPTASTSKFILERKKNAIAQHIQVEVKDILETLQKVISLHPQQKIFLKIDCEGEEYVIMDRLNNAAALRNIAGFLIEWHIKGPDPILNILNHNDFMSVHLPQVGGVTGMIYGFQ